MHPFRAAVESADLSAVPALLAEDCVESADGVDHALIFRAKVDGRDVHGCDFLHHGPDGLITEFTVMVRPLSAANALAQAMAVEFEAITRELAAG